MQIAATTSHAALTASPRLSATIANATAPRSATAIHKSFVCGALELLMVLMGCPPALQESPHKTSFILAGTLIKAKVYLREKIYITTCRRRTSEKCELLITNSEVIQQTVKARTQKSSVLPCKISAMWRTYAVI